MDSVSALSVMVAGDVLVWCLCVFQVYNLSQNVQEDDLQHLQVSLSQQMLLRAAHTIVFTLQGLVFKLNSSGYFTQHFCL